MPHHTIETPVLIRRSHFASSQCALHCNRCLRAAAPPGTQIRLAMGLSLRELRRESSGAPSEDALPNDEYTSCTAPCWCTEGLCTVAYCSEACRSAHHTAHLLLCERGGLQEGAPLREFHSLARRQPDEALAMTAVLIADAMAEVLDDEQGEVDAQARGLASARCDAPAW